MKKNPYKKRVRDLESQLRNVRDEIDDLLDPDEQDDDSEKEDE